MKVHLLLEVASNDRSLTYSLIKLANYYLTAQVHLQRICIDHLTFTPRSFQYGNKLHCCYCNLNLL